MCSRSQIPRAAPLAGATGHASEIESWRGWAATTTGISRHARTPIFASPPVTQPKTLISALPPALLGHITGSAHTRWRVGTDSLPPQDAFALSALGVSMSSGRLTLTPGKKGAKKNS